MSASERITLLGKIAELQSSKAILYVTSDRVGMEAQIANDAYDFFVQHLDKMWPTKKISLILHTNGGNTSAAWRIVTLLRSFADDLEVIIINKALSAGTLISLGANQIVMTKQASLGPIDPSLSGPLSPQVPGNPNQRVPVSVEVVQGYIDLARDELKITDSASLAGTLIDLSSKVHPLVLGQIFRSRNQIRSLAEKLLVHQGLSEENRKRTIDFLCSESGSHDRTIGRREAQEMGLAVTKPSDELYALLRDLYEDFTASMETRTRFDPTVVLAGQPQASFVCERMLLESVEGGSARYVSEGTVRGVTVPPQPGISMMPMSGTEMTTTFEGWRTSP